LLTNCFLSSHLPGGQTIILERVCLGNKAHSKPFHKRPRLVNSDLLNFDYGAKSAAALQPRATPWVSESIGPSWRGGGFLRAFRA
jgi:hypothetical protein